MIFFLLILDCELPLTSKYCVRFMPTCSWERIAMPIHRHGAPNGRLINFAPAAARHPAARRRLLPVLMATALGVGLAQAQDANKQDANKHDGDKQAALTTTADPA